MIKFLSDISTIVSRYKTLVENFSYLTVLQVINMVVPIITYPYLIRILGKETYGLIVFAQAIVSYLLILVSFGFNISATNAISVNRDNKEMLSTIVSSILIIKGVLLLFSFTLIIALVSYIPEAGGHKALFLLSMWICIFDVMFPSWYFQGIEKMKYITYLMLTNRLISLILIFTLIHSIEDYLFVPFIYGIGSLIAGIIALGIVFGSHKIEFRWQPFKSLKIYFIDSIPIFISNVSISIYLTSNRVIAGAFLGMQEVAYYDLAEKLIGVLKIPQTLLSQSIFPKISKDKSISFIKKIFKLSIVGNIAIFLGILVFSKYLILLLGGLQMLASQVIVNILAITIPIVAMSNIFGMLTLLPFGHSRIFTRVITMSGIVYFLQLALLYFTAGFSIIGLSIVTVITEAFVTSFMFYYCKKLNLW